MSELIERLNRETNAAFSTATGGHTPVQLTAHEVRALLSTIVEQERTIVGLESRLAKVEGSITEFEEALAFTDVLDELPSEDGLYECFVGEEDDLESGGHALLDFIEGEFLFEDTEHGLVPASNVLYWRPLLPRPGETLAILPDDL